jgi:hypothetical protein
VTDRQESSGTENERLPDNNDQRRRNVGVVAAIWSAAVFGGSLAQLALPAEWDQPMKIAKPAVAGAATAWFIARQKQRQAW